MKPVSSVSLYDEAGWSGLCTTKTSGRGIVDEEWSRDLKYPKAHKFYQEMEDNSPVVAAMLEYFYTLMLRPETVVEPNPKGRKLSKTTALEAADFVESVLDDMSHTWRQAMFEMLTAFPKGWASMEIVLKRRLGASPGINPQTGKPFASSRHDDGRIGLRALKLRGQDTLETWEFDEKGDFRGWWQYQPFGGTPRYVPLGKTLHVRFRSIKNNPEGHSGLRPGKLSYFFVKRGQEYEGIGIMRDVGGTVVIRVPRAMMASNANAAMKAARATLEVIAEQLGTDERRGLVFAAKEDKDGPTGYDIETLQTGQNLAYVNTAIVRHEQRLAMSLLMQWLFMAMDKVGAYGAQKNSSDISGIAVAAKLDHLYDLINRHLIRPLMKLNTWPEEFWPTLTHGQIDPLDVATLGQYVGQLLSSGAIAPTSALQRALLVPAGLPVPEQESA